MAKKFAKSLAVERAWPSAMFAGTETAALVIWLVSPKPSLAGKLSVRSYTLSTRSIAFCHTRRSR